MRVESRLIFNRFQNFKKQAGLTLIELMLGLIIAGIASVVALSALRSEQRNTMAELVGKQLNTMGGLTNAFVANHYQEIIGNVPVTTPGLACVGVYPARTCILTPEIVFVNQGHLPTGWQNILPYDSAGRWDVRLRIATAASGNWVEGLVIATTPWLNLTLGGTPIAADSLGEAAKIAGADAGVVGLVDGTNTNLEGVGNVYTITNATYPSITTRGQIGLRVGSGSFMFGAFLRRDGQNAMTGDLDMGGNSVQNATDIQARGDISAGTNVYVAGQANIAGNLVGQNLVAANNVTANNQVAASVGSFPANLLAPQINYQGGATAFGAQQAVSAGQNPYSALSAGAAIGSGTVSVDDVYIRRLGVWASSIAPRYVALGSWMVTNQSVVLKPGQPGSGMPACDSTGAVTGVPKIELTPGRQGVDTMLLAGGSAFSGSVSIPLPGPMSYGAFYVYATDNGTSWTARLESQDATIWGPGTGQALATVYCDYPVRY